MNTTKKGCLWVTSPVHCLDKSTIFSFLYRSEKMVLIATHSLDTRSSDIPVTLPRYVQISQVWESTPSFLPCSLPLSNRHGNVFWSACYACYAHWFLPYKYSYLCKKLWLPPFPRLLWSIGMTLSPLNRLMMYSALTFGSSTQRCLNAFHASRLTLNGAYMSQ